MKFAKQTDELGGAKCPARAAFDSFDFQDANRNRQHIVAAFDDIAKKMMDDRPLHPSKVPEEIARKAWLEAMPEAPTESSYEWAKRVAKELGWLEDE